MYRVPLSSTMEGRRFIPLAKEAAMTPITLWAAEAMNLRELVARPAPPVADVRRSYGEAVRFVGHVPAWRPVFQRAAEILAAGERRQREEAEAERRRAKRVRHEANRAARAAENHAVAKGLFGCGKKVGGSGNGKRRAA
ncbi:hypothetical protein HYW67_03150 [Candidatus Parcubacteria bacterium]|nr:hypothetical protein [Candidatus Parcubacteria bacterium]